MTSSGIKRSASAATILLYLPAGSIPPVLSGEGDLILVMYLLPLPALALVAGGFASGSPYATVGAQREMVTMMVYEFPLVIAVIAIAWRISMAGIGNPFSLAAISCDPVFGFVGPVGFIGCLLILVVLVLVVPGELSRIPYDTPEAETELAGGILVAYSGKNLALFYLAQSVKTLIMTSLVVALFFPYNISGFMAIAPPFAALADFVFFVVKVFLVMFVSVSLIRVGMTRFRINQVVSGYWMYLSAVGIVGLILIMLDYTAGVW
jgi:formate hydrogenlyase subunit 4